MALGTVGQQVFLGSNRIQLLSNGAEAFLNPYSVEMAVNPVTNGRVLELNNTAASYPGTGDTWFDISGNGYNFKQTGSAAWGGTSVGWNLNGSTQYLYNSSSLPNQWSGPVTSSLTIFVHANPKVVNSGDRTLYGNWRAVETKILYEINTNSTMELAIRNSVGIQGGDITGTVSTGDAVYMMIASGSALFSFRNNSQLASSIAISGTWTTQNPATYLGAREFPANTVYGAMSGSIKAVVAYNRLLSTTERQQVYDYLLTL